MENLSSIVYGYNCYIKFMPNGYEFQIIPALN